MHASMGGGWGCRNSKMPALGNEVSSKSRNDMAVIYNLILIVVIII